MGDQAVESQLSSCDGRLKCGRRPAGERVGEANVGATVSRSSKAAGGKMRCDRRTRVFAAINLVQASRTEGARCCRGRGTRRGRFRKA